MTPNKVVASTNIKDIREVIRELPIFIEGDTDIETYLDSVHAILSNLADLLGEVVDVVCKDNKRITLLERTRDED